MKKKKENKIKKVKKGISGLKKMVLCIFIIFLSLVFVLLDRKYFFLEIMCKNINASVNSFIIDNAYSKSSFSSNILDSRIEYLKRENNHLKKLVNLKEENNKLIVSTVINHNALDWYKKIEINKGSKDGVKKGFAVINEEGLIGFISKVSFHESEVRLLTSVDENSMLLVSLLLKNGSVAGILDGYNEKKDVFMIKNVMYKDEILGGTKVVLSGFNNDSYKGIYIGLVMKEETDNYGLSKNIEVASSVNFDDLLYVAVLGD